LSQFNTLQDLCRFSSDPKARAKLSCDLKLNTVGFNTLQNLYRFSSDPKARAKLSGDPKHNTVGFNTSGLILVSRRLIKLTMEDTAKALNTILDGFRNRCKHLENITADGSLMLPRIVQAQEVFIRVSELTTNLNQ